MPAICLEAAGYILRETQRGIAIYGDVVVIVQDIQLSQTQMTGQGGGLACYAFHQIAVTREGPNPVIHDRVVRPVEMLRQQTFRDGKPHRVPESLSQWPSGGLHAGGVPAFRVPRGQRPPLAEVLDLLERQVIPAEVKKGVE
jgi:hypothetical protein